MPLNSRLVEWFLGLPSPSTRKLIIEHGLKVAMRDDAVLLADRWAPASGGDGLPVALMRSPYGRSVGLVARPLAERGFQVIVQSTRGTFGPDGPFDPFRRERDDGLDTLDWIIAQPWFGDAIVLVGGSYVGYVQWAVADAAPPQVKAMIPAVAVPVELRSFPQPPRLELQPVRETHDPEAADDDARKKMPLGETRRADRWPAGPRSAAKVSTKTARSAGILPQARGDLIR